MSGHEPEPLAGTAYVAAGPFIGRPATLPYEGHDAATAHCSCGQMLWCDGNGPEGGRARAPWRHAGRMPGDPG